MNDTRLDKSGGGIPIACNLPEAKLVERGANLSEKLFSGCEEVAESQDGYAFRFSGEEAWASRLFRFVSEEWECCPFFQFELVFEPGSGPIWLRLSGGEGVKEFIRENFPVAQAR